MKNLKFLVLATFLVTIVSNAFSQSVVRDYEDRRYRIVADCDGQIVVLDGRVDIHMVTHINPGKGRISWRKFMVHGEMTDRFTGEVFRVNFHRKLDYSPREQTIHANLVGDNGTHIIYSITYGFDEDGVWGVLDEKAKCI